MVTLARRRFLLSLAGLLPASLVTRRLHAWAVDALDPRVLRALAGAVLPSELGAAGREGVVAGFERWLAGYREGAELLHGYGSGEIRRTGPTPAVRWAGQLAALEALARSRGKTFVEMEPAERQGLVRAALEGERPGGMPEPDRAGHVVVGLMAFYYASPEAADLCYNARIGRNTCRPLGDSAARPLPLARGGS